MSMTPRARSSVLAPSLTRMASGRSLMTVRNAPSALWKSIGAEFFISLGAILAMLSSLFDLTALIQSAGGAGHLPSMPSRRAETHEPTSPTSGATIPTLLSISFGSMSIWMSFFDPGSPQVLPLPCDRSQFSRAPISMTTSESFSTVERAAPAHCGCVSGKRPFAMLIGLRVCRAFAEDDQGALGALQDIERTLDSGRSGKLGRCRIDDLDE